LACAGTGVALVVGDLGISRCVLGVVPDLGAAWALELELWGVVRAEFLTVWADPLLGWCFLVDLIEPLLVRSGLVGSLGGSGRKDISADQAEVIEEFTCFTVCDEKGDQSSEVSGGLVGVLLGIVL